MNLSKVLQIILALSASSVVKADRLNEIKVCLVSCLGFVRLFVKHELKCYFIISLSHHKLSFVQIMEGHTVQNDFYSPQPHTYIDPEALPDKFSWGNIEGVSYLTKNLNQHIPQYCGSCWAHGSLSALGDRIKYQKDKAFPQNSAVDVNLSIQFILNCGGDVAGSCYGGSASGTYEFIKQVGYVPFDTCQQYLACSSDSKEGFCAHVDTTCNKMNTCRTCNTFSQYGGECVEVSFIGSV